MSTNSSVILGKRSLNKMKAVLQNQPGDENTMYVGDTDIPEPGDGEILIRVCCTALNRMDLLQCKGLYPLPEGASPILGVEVSGYVHSIGPNCTNRFKVGDRCMALLQGGGYAEYAVAYECTTMAVPDGISMTTLASIPEQWMTAYQLLFKVAGVSSGERVLLHAAASGVGQAAIQLATAAGAQCIATCRSDDKVACCLKMGATHAYNVKVDTAFSAMVKADSSGSGVDVVLDPVGATYAAENLDVINRDGRWVLYGLMGGKGIEDPVFLGKILAKRLTLVGSTLRARPKAYKEELAKAIESEVMPKVVSGEFQVLVDSSYPMTTEGVRNAHRHMASNSNIGKIVLVVSEA
mmetsp:Transcript_1691/g.2670  ORF Transcript_1691/g.2670 Transcript_1691/m.2670 type:complete len:351 (+) Transcript_1691:3-1055(+)